MTGIVIPRSSRHPAISLHRPITDRAVATATRRRRPIGLQFEGLGRKSEHYQTSVATETPQGELTKRRAIADSYGNRLLDWLRSDPRTGVVPGITQDRNMRSRCRCSMCPAIHITSRSWLRSSSTHEPSDPPLRVVFQLIALDGQVRIRHVPDAVRVRYYQTALGASRSAFNHPSARQTIVDRDDAPPFRSTRYFTRRGGIGTGRQVIQARPV